MKSVLTSLLVVLFISCNSDDDSSLPIDYREENEQEILAYIDDYNLDATRTDSGLYYVIDEIGEGAEITSTSDVSVRYKGTFTDGTILDENFEDGISINLQQTIYGWSEGLQLFREGGSGMLLIPSHLAYGSQDVNGVPAGSVLVFEIQVIDYHVENREEILAYIEDNNLDAAIESDTGLFYVIDDEGNGDQPTENSNVTVVYKGYFTNGDVFDESNENGVSFNLNQVIPGWTEGIQYFKEGGKGQLLVPSALAYGKYGRYDQMGNQVIPNGAVLIFDIDLKSVN